MTQTDKQAELDRLHALYKNCTLCTLSTPARQNIVFGSGNANASLMFIGEAPGKEEDAKGVPFIGRSGKLFTRSIEACGIQRSQTFITNVAKCRPPNNRKPLQKEIFMCKNILLFNQIKIIQPKIIATVGACPLQLFTKKRKKLFKISKIHGQVFEWNNILIVPLYHPAYILCNNKKLSLFLSDIALLKKLLDQKHDS
jgi:uracil-DNA glycosylase family 4